MDKPNLRDRMAVWRADAIVGNQDLIEACSRIQKSRNDGNIVSDKKSEIKKMKAVSAFLSGITRLREVILQLVKRSSNEVIRKQTESRRNAGTTYLTMIQKKNTVMVVYLPPSSWSVAQSKIIIKVLKIKEGGDMPTRKVDLLSKCNELEGEITCSVDH